MCVFSLDRYSIGNLLAIFFFINVHHLDARCLAELTIMILDFIATVVFIPVSFCLLAALAAVISILLLRGCPTLGLFLHL